MPGLKGEPSARLTAGRGDHPKRHKPVLRLRRISGDAGRHSPWPSGGRGTSPSINRKGACPVGHASAYGMALGTATAGPEAASAGRFSDGAQRTRRTGDGLGRVAMRKSGNQGNTCNRQLRCRVAKAVRAAGTPALPPSRRLVCYGCQGRRFEKRAFGGPGMGQQGVAASWQGAQPVGRASAALRAVFRAGWLGGLVHSGLIAAYVAMVIHGTGYAPHGIG